MPALRNLAARGWQPAIAIAILLVACVAHLGVALTSRAPVYWEDEAGYLLNAQVLSGYGAIPSLQGQSYYPGWSMFLVPLWWILKDPDVVYHGAVVMSALFALGTTVPLALIGRRLGLNLWLSLAAAGAVILGSQRVLMSDFALSENCLAFFVALSVLLAMRFAEKVTLGRAVALGAAAGYAFVVHGRAIPLVIATGLWFAWVLFRRRWTSPGRAAAAGIATMAVVVAAGMLIYRWSSSLIFPDTGRENDAISKVFGSDPFGTALAGAGQTWYHVAASLGLVAIGLVVIARDVVAEWRARKPSTATWTALFLLGAGAIAFTYISNGVSTLHQRLDIYIYGRYLDPFLTVVWMIGAVALLRVMSRRLLMWIAIGTAAMALIYLVIGLTIVPGIGTNGWWAPLNVLGLLQWPWPGASATDSIPLIQPTLVLLAALVVMLVLRTRPVVILLIFAVFFAGSSFVSLRTNLRPFVTLYYDAFELRHVVREYDADHTLQFDTFGLDASIPGVAAPDTVSRNAYQYWLVPRSPELIDTATQAPTAELVISRPDWPRADEFGARLVAVDTGFQNALWVMPGELQDELVAAGGLPAQP